MNLQSEDAMKRMLGSWLALVGLALLAGCVELKQKIAIAPDGELAVSYSYAVRQADVRFWEEAQAAAGRVRNDGRPSEQEHPLWPFDEAAVMQWFQARAGVPVKNYAIVSSAEKKTVSFEVECADAGKGLQSGAFGQFSFARDVPAPGLVTIAAVQRRPVIETMGESDWRKLEGLCQGLKLELEMTVPGRIEATDGKVSPGSPSTVRWLVDVDNDPGVLRKLPVFKVVYRPAKK